MGLGAIFLIALGSGCSEPASGSGFVPGLGEIMGAQQMRHSKLWFAGQAQNWPLAGYELDELQEGFADAVTFHPTHKDCPEPLTTLVPQFTDEPVAELRAAIAARDETRFMAAHDGLTAACNGCHEAAGFGYNRVTRPTTNPYSNQDFNAPH